MIKLLLDKYSNRFASRYLILALDIVVVITSYFLAKMIRFNFRIHEISWDSLEFKIPIIVSSYTFCFIIFKSYKGVIRHTSLEDTIRILKACFLATLILSTLTFVLSKYGVQTYFNVPFSSLLVLFLLNSFILVNVRLIIKEIFAGLFDQPLGGKKNVIIYGAGQSGLITLNTINRENKLNYNVVGFIDDNPSIVGKSIGGIMVLSPEEGLNGFLNKKHVQEVIISIQNIDSKRKREIIDFCISRDIVVKNVPPIGRWINGELSAGQIKSVNIEDLLQREPINLDTKNISRQLKNKIVMITGAAGSIGSEISRQVLRFNPEKIILVDQAETPLYDLEHQIQYLRKSLSTNIKFVVADVQNEDSMRRIFEEHPPEIIFHAAAYKHVPMMENNPFEAVRVNIFGTKLLADLAIQYQVKKFIMVSTDKAVNPTNVMGASKRAAEIYIQSLGTLKGSTTSFITTRFGNVLGSNGSVIPLFKKQIESGGPITVTHPEITRYFMTIPEACQLVLEAGAMGKGGEIFIFDMGESVKIMDVAKNMVKLYGLKLGKDIQIEITGLRPGEKLYEELLNTEENSLPTYHPKIMIAKVQENSLDQINTQLTELSKVVKLNKQFLLVKKIKEIVPEFISNNSVFEELDFLVDIENLPFVEA